MMMRHGGSEMSAVASGLWRGFYELPVSTLSTELPSYEPDRWNFTLAFVHRHLPITSSGRGETEFVRA